MKEKVKKKESSVKDEIEKLKEVLDELLTLIQTRNF